MAMHYRVFIIYMHDDDHVCWGNQKLPSWDWSQCTEMQYWLTPALRLYFLWCLREKHQEQSLHVSGHTPSVISLQSQVSDKAEIDLLRASHDSTTDWKLTLEYTMVVLKPPRILTPPLHLCWCRSMFFIVRQQAAASAPSTPAPNDWIWTDYQIRSFIHCCL